MEDTMGFILRARWLFVSNCTLHTGFCPSMSVSQSGGRWRGWQSPLDHTVPEVFLKIVFLSIP